jgi:murein DD-endopeptidase MepM/ murein hydrolase activator NlpD
MIRHNNANMTVYAHLSRIDVRKGQSVDQGQKIGAVGATGWATGPHLHFEFRVNGQHKDPSTLARQSEATPVSTAARPMFEQQVQLNRVALAAAANMNTSGAQ